MIRRILTDSLLEASAQSPIVAVTGPRQSGKTTLCRSTFPDHEYVSLEPLDTRDFARSDPRGFLRTYSGAVVLDEVQRAPELFSYLQDVVDRDPKPGRIVLTGSQHFGLTEGISQSLAGRVALLHLLPFSLDELMRFEDQPHDLWTTIWTGGYPRIHDRGLTAADWLADYVATYVQRDVRQITQVNDLDAFTAFLRLAAGRTGQEVNLSSIGSDAGVSHNTIRSWISVLEASFVLFRLPPWVGNVRKRIVKAPKLHFFDTGLVSHLLGIRSPEQLALHPLRGAIFESWVAAEVYKALVHRRRPVDLFHLRESRGAEVDLIVESGDRLIGVEAKSGATVAGEMTVPLRGWPEASPGGRRVTRRVLYGGDAAQTRGEVDVVPWKEIQRVGWV